MNRRVLQFALAIVSPVMFGWLADVSSAQITQGLATDLWNTGVDNLGVPLPNGTVGDPHYSLVTVPSTASSTTLVAVTTGNYPVYPAGGWVNNPADTPQSDWIGPGVSANGATWSLQDPSIGGYFDYQTTFNLSAAGAVLLTGQWSADNHGVDILLDGVSTGNSTIAPGYPSNQYPGTDPSFDFEQWTPFTISGTGSLGTNTLDFLVYNSVPSPVVTGLRVEFDSSVPEPSTLVLLGIGAIGLLGVAWRKRTTRLTQQAPSFSACRKTLVAVIMALTCVSVGSKRAAATILYASSNSGDQIDRVDTVANTVTTYINAPNDVDSLMFDSTGRVIYSEDTAGDVRRYDPSIPSDTAIATGLGTPADIVLEPGGNSMLVSEYGGGQIDRINLNTLAVTTLSSPGGNPEGLAYDGTRLFANLGLRYGGPTGKYVAQIDPVTGAILATSPGLNDLDGLVYDPYSGLLYATSYLGNTIYAIDPNNLSIVQNLLGGTGTGGIPSPDGITTDGVGDLFIASSEYGGDSHIYQYNLVTQVLTQETYVAGLDDLAPASGLGSLPEPSSLVLLAASAIGLLTYAWRRRR